MKHQPNKIEQEKIDRLLEEFEFDFEPIRLTETMLAKSIMDASLPIRVLLARMGEVDYAAMEQGRASGMELTLDLASERGLEKRSVSFYRPETKSGDPRFWISRLGDAASAGGMLLACRQESVLFFIALDANLGALTSALGRLLPRREGSLRDMNRALAEFEQRFRDVRERGWIPTMRAGDTGIGFTFESLLGVRANSAQKPDFHGFELKCYRAGRGSGSRVSLFSKTPEWGSTPRGRGILARAGRLYEDTGRLRLYCTIDTRANTFELALSPNDASARVDVLHRSNPLVHYSFAVLEKKLRSKHARSIFISARTRGSGQDEEFCFDSAHLCTDLSFGSFLQLILADVVTLDFTLSVRENGSTRDHGYLWRIPATDIPQLFNYRRQIGA